MKEVKEKLNRNLKQKEKGNQNNAASGKITLIHCSNEKQTIHRPKKRGNAWGSQTSEPSQRRIEPAKEELQHKDSP